VKEKYKKPDFNMSSRKGTKAEASAVPEWMRQALECPVCLEIIMDPPIYQCENPQGHTVCSACHETLLKERKPCPVCRQELKSRRNVTLECMLENDPSRTKCKFDVCDFKRLDAEAVKKHEDECENRDVACAWCYEKISLRGLAQHVVEKHYNGTEFKMDSFGRTLHLSSWAYLLKKEQAVFTVTADDHCKFLFNWCSSGDVKLFWVAYIGKKVLSSNYKYTLQVESKDRAKKYIFEGTRNCIPCDLSHTDVKKKKWALVLDNDLLADATKEDGKLCYTLTIDKS